MSADLREKLAFVCLDAAKRAGGRRERPPTKKAPAGAGAKTAPLLKPTASRLGACDRKQTIERHRHENLARALHHVGLPFVRLALQAVEVEAELLHLGIDLLLEDLAGQGV